MASRQEFRDTLHERMTVAGTPPAVGRIELAIVKLFAAITVEASKLPAQHAAAVTGLAAEFLYGLGEKLANEFR